MPIKGSLGAIFAQSPDQVVACDCVGYDPAAQGLVEFTDQATTASAGNTRYTITDPALRYWSADHEIIVKRNGSAITTGFTIECPGGVVVFDVAQAGGTVITVSGTAISLMAVGGCFNWAMEPVSDTRDATKFTSGGWRENKQTLNSFVATARALWWAGNWHRDLGKQLILVLYPDNSQRRYEGFVLVSEDSVESAVDTLVEETIGFTGKGPVYYRGT